MPNANSIPRLARRRVAAVALLLAGLLAGAGSAAAQRAPATQLRVIDDTGRAVEMPQPLRRIVSLAPSATETLFALGLGDRVVGDTDYCDFPAEAKTRPHVGGVENPNLETIVALHPDVVVASRTINRLATVEALERLGVPVYVTDARTVQQVVDSAETLGGVLGAGDASAQAIAELRARLARLHDAGLPALAARDPKRVFFVVWQTPLISVGQNTFLADALRWAGAKSVVDAPQDWPEVSLEQLVYMKPDYLIFSSDQPEATQRQIAQLAGQPGWRDLDALRAHRIVILGEAINHPSPRLFDAIEELARALHPEAFPGSAQIPALSPAARAAAPGAF